MERGPGAAGAISYRPVIWRTAKGRDDIGGRDMGIERIGVVGSGIMGSGIAEVAATSGHEVVLRSRKLESAETTDTVPTSSRNCGGRM